MAATSAATVATTMFGDAFRSTAFGASQSISAGGNVLVVISLRGGIDGLGVVVPHGDQGYYQARPTTAVPVNLMVIELPPTSFPRISADTFG